MWNIKGLIFNNFNSNNHHYGLLFNKNISGKKYF